MQQLSPMLTLSSIKELHTIIFSTVYLDSNFKEAHYSLKCLVQVTGKTSPWMMSYLGTSVSLTVQTITSEQQHQEKKRKEQ